MTDARTPSLVVPIPSRENAPAKALRLLVGGRVASGPAPRPTLRTRPRRQPHHLLRHLDSRQVALRMPRRRVPLRSRPRRAVLRRPQHRPRGRSMKRRCIVDDCRNLTTGTRCALHRRRQARGYDVHHDRARRSMLALLPIRCAYCYELIRTPDELAAAHVQDGNPRAGWQPSHRTCNQGAKIR